VQCIEPIDNGGHSSMDLEYLVLSKGSTLLAGKKVEVSCVNVDKVIGNKLSSNNEGWKQVSFVTNFAKPPIILSQITSDKNKQMSASTTSPNIWFVPSIRNVTANGFEAALDADNINTNKNIAGEEVCFAALESGDFKFATSASTQLAQCEVNVMKANGWNDKCRKGDLKTSFSLPPISVGGIQNRRGKHGWVRKKCDSTLTSVSFVIDENNKKRTHKVDEKIGYLACDLEIK